MTELAARWAADLSCPLPILVRLRDVARVCSSPSDVTLSLLSETAARHAPASERADLVEAMRDSIAAGSAVLLLDGLDECLDRSSLVAEGLKRTLAALPVPRIVQVQARRDVPSPQQGFPSWLSGAASALHRR